MVRVLSIAVALLLAAAPAAAQQIQLEIKDGRVNLDATGAPVRAILAEWARVGGTQVVGGERIAGAPVTLTLRDLPEDEALEIILRSVAGYMAAPRAQSASAGASRYDRIMVLATSAAPAASANRGANPPMMPGGDGRIVRPPGFRPVQPVEEVEDDQGEDVPVFTFPQPGQAQAPDPDSNVFVPVEESEVPFGEPGETVNAPVITLQPNPAGAPTVYTFTPPRPGPNFGQASPFGVGSAVPGVIQQPPAQPEQPQPPPPRRPPPQ